MGIAKLFFGSTVLTTMSEIENPQSFFQNEKHDFLIS